MKSQPLPNWLGTNVAKWFLKSHESMIDVRFGVVCFACIEKSLSRMADVVWVLVCCVITRSFSGPTSGRAAMFGKGKTHEMVAILVDHLDKSLAAGERLAETSFLPRSITADMTADQILGEHARLREFLDGLRALEMTLAARIDKARSWAREMRLRDGNLKLMASLFLTGTQALDDAMQDMADPRLQDFNGGDQALYFLKTRGLISEHVTVLDEVARIGVGEAYMIAGRIQLGALLDLCATFIDTLDLHYKLFERPEPVVGSLDGAPQVQTVARIH